METIRLTLVILHILIAIFLINTLPVRPGHTEKLSKRFKQICFTIEYMKDLFCILLYHSSSIIAVWSKHRYTVGMIYATGILLISELSQFITKIIINGIESHYKINTNLFLDTGFIGLIVVAIILSFRLAYRLYKCDQDIVQTELFTSNVSETSSREEGQSSLV